MPYCTAAVKNHDCLISQSTCWPLGQGRGVGVAITCKIYPGILKGCYYADFDDKINYSGHILEHKGRLDTIPGIGREMLSKSWRKSAPTRRIDSHLCSWAGMSPGNHECAGKRKSGRTRKGNKKRRYALVEAARSVVRTPNTHLSAQYHRIAARSGADRAAVAVGYTILTTLIIFSLREQD
ncbi:MULTISPECIES: transposase [Paenibacillus]|uniref:transposase n=1 Tax=Paenibacillus TaxID=44249 RepID=UPI0022A70683|nr:MULTISPECIES: transposase [Paenibacillus]